MLREATAMTVRQNLGELLNEVQYRHDEIVITKAGKPVAALVDIATYEQIKRRKNGEFERLWADIAKGFEDLSAQDVDALLHEQVQAVRTQRHALAGAAQQ